MLHASPLPRMVLRAVYALTESGTSASLPAVVAVVPAPANEVVETVRALDRAGYLNAERMRLTMQGLAAACAPRVAKRSTTGTVAVERRKTPRDRHWAGTVAEPRPGLRKVAIVA